METVLLIVQTLDDLGVLLVSTLVAARVVFIAVAIVLVAKGTSFTPDERFSVMAASYVISLLIRMIYLAHSRSVDAEEKAEKQKRKAEKQKRKVEKRRKIISDAATVARRARVQWYTSWNLRTRINGLMQGCLVTLRHVVRGVLPVWPQDVRV